MSIENTMFYVSIAAQGRNNIALQKLKWSRPQWMSPKKCEILGWRTWQQFIKVSFSTAPDKSRTNWAYVNSMDEYIPLDTTERVILSDSQLAFNKPLDLTNDL